MRDNVKMRFLEPGEVQALMQVPSLRSLSGLRNRCVMGLMYEAGLRISEALGSLPVWIVGVRLESQCLSISYFRRRPSKEGGVSRTGPRASLVGRLQGPK